MGTNVQEYVQRYTDHPEKLIGPLASVGLGLAGALATLVLMLITAYYMAMNPGPLVQSALRLVPPARRQRALHILHRLRQSWVGWLRGVVFDMLITGILLYLGLRLVGLDFALVFAVLVGAARGDPVLRRGGRRHPARAVRAHRFARQGAARARGLRGRPADRGQRDHPPRDGPHRQAPPGGDSDRRGAGGPGLRHHRPLRGGTDPLRDRASAWRSSTSSRWSRGGEERRPTSSSCRARTSRPGRSFPRRSGKLDRRDHDRGDREDDDGDLHADPEGRKLHYSMIACRSAIATACVRVSA